MKSIFIKLSVSIVLVFMFAGWGGTGHKIINRNITQSFPSAMKFPAYWSDTLTAHASDADNRKSKDPTESPKHFINIDYYPEFITNGHISQSYDTNVQLHTSTYVINEGTLPWAIQWTEDSLKVAFQQRNWHKVMMLSADLGHYVGDGHQPLHITQNYDGGMTNQSGVHSRYETTLVGQFQNSIVYTNDSASYVSNISNYVFDFIYLGNKYVDSVLYGDSVAHAVTGTTSGTAYLQKYWDICGNHTIQLMKNASKAVADLIYTAWINAGSPDPNGVTPVELVSFTSSVDKDIINLNWKTATELNNTGFDIERGSVKNSVGEVIFTKIGFVKGAGSSLISHSYSFSDKIINSGKYYYRLKQIDNDGSVKLSNAVEVNYKSAVLGYYLDQNYPNPFNPSTQIKYALPFNSNVKITIINSLGETIKVLANEVQASGVHNMNFNAVGLSSGVYLYSIQANAVDGSQSFRATKKMILMK